MHASPNFDFHLPQLRLQSLAHRLPKDRETAFLRVFPQMCVKPRKLKVAGFPSPRLRPVWPHTAQRNQSRFLRMQFQSELGEPLAQLGQEPLGLRLVWKPTTKSSAKRTTTTSPRACRFLHAGPVIKYVVEVDIGQQRRCTAALRRPLLHVRFPSSSTPAFSHFWMSRTIRRSPIRCSTNFTSHSCEITSKKHSRWSDSGFGSSPRPFYSLSKAKQYPDDHRSMLSGD